MREVQRHVDAFELYFQLKQGGSSTKASVEQVASKQNYNVTTVWKWKKKFKWDAREAVRGSEINKRVEEKTNSRIVDNKVVYLSYYHHLLDDLKKNFNIKIESVSDLKKVVDGCLVLQGEPSEHIEQNSQHDVSVHDRIKEYEKRFRAARKGDNSSDDIC